VTKAIVLPSPKLLCYPRAAGFLLLLTSLLDALSGYAAVRVLTAPFIWLGTNSLAVFAGDIMLQVSTAASTILHPEQLSSHDPHAVLGPQEAYSGDHLHPRA